MLSTLGVLPACLEELLGVLPAWELLLPCEALSLAEHLTTWGRTALSVWGRVLSSGEAWEVPAWEISLSLRKSALHWGSLGTACLEDLTLCLGKSVIHWGSLGTACLGDFTLCLGKSAISPGSLGTACLRRPGNACLGDCTLCLGKSAIYQGSWGIVCLRDCTCCLGRSAVYWGSLRVACLGDSTLGKSTICLGNLRGGPRS